MKRKYITAMMLAFATLPMCAQETYEMAKLVGRDLNGTARYVGMGGAMEALGADISTIRTNPAGLGFFRHSKAMMSFGGRSQEGASKFADGKPTVMSFDQAGFVFSLPSSGRSFVNFAFNYSKSRNFNQILSAASKLNGASQNKLSYLKGMEGVFGIPSHEDGRPKLNDNGALVSPDNTFSQLDYLYYNTLLYNPNLPVDEQYGFYEADSYGMRRTESGYIGTYDFNVSGNINDRVYIGATVGIHDVHYKGYSEYRERMLPNMDNVEETMLDDYRRISGTGIDLRVGVIFRPIEYSPFRIGLHVATPIFYDLTTSNDTRLSYSNFDGYGTIGEDYDFQFETPWEFGISLGHTVGKSLAIGASYEYADYSNCKVKVNTGGYYDEYWGYYNDSSNDRAMNSHINNTLKGVSTFKMGTEYKVMDNVALRLGYNYVSPLYSEHGYKDSTLDSPGSYYASATDYINWGATNRVTCGVGFRADKFNFDVAYQYSSQEGDFFPFLEYEAADPHSGLDNICGPQKVENKHHQLLMTVGYTF